MRTSHHTTEVRRGFTLLLAVLVSSVLIALGSAIYDIVSKEIILSSAGRESQFSFYAADTGIECGLYHDLKNDLFATSSGATTVTCGGGAPGHFVYIPDWWKCGNTAVRNRDRHAPTIPNCNNHYGITWLQHLRYRKPLEA